jgi:hypothetical protein
MDMILCIGVDVSSRTFEASLGAEAAKGAQFPNDEAGFAAFAAWCDARVRTIDRHATG